MGRGGEEEEPFSAFTKNSLLTFKAEKIKAVKIKSQVPTIVDVEELSFPFELHPITQSTIARKAISLFLPPVTLTKSRENKTM